MVAIAHLAGAFVLFAFVTHIGTILNALRRLRVPPEQPAPVGGPPVTIIRPVCGVDAYEEFTLRSTFELDYPQFEILFCCASGEDRVVPLVQRLIAEHPSVKARLLIGDDQPSQNPKLNNVVKGWRMAAHEWIVIADSNVAMPRDYLQRLLAAWDGSDTGLVSAPPIGTHADSIGAELECAYLNTYQARWQYAACSLGGGFAQGKNMLWRRSDLESGGGILALAREPAEDAAATKVVRGLGLRIRLADGAFPQPLGARTVAQVWNRQVRWARLRRATFPGFFGLEILSGLAAPLLCFVFAAWVQEMESFDVLAVGSVYVAVWFAAEAWLAAALGWHLTWRSPLLWVLRELLLPALLLQAWLGKSLSWRGNAMTSARGDDAALRPGALGS